LPFETEALRDIGAAHPAIMLARATAETADPRRSVFIMPYPLRLAF
jgi:hypothetical protein